VSDSAYKKNNAFGQTSTQRNERLVRSEEMGRQRLRGSWQERKAAKNWKCRLQKAIITAPPTLERNDGLGKRRQLHTGRGELEGAGVKSEKKN